MLYRIHVNKSGTKPRTSRFQKLSMRRRPGTGFSTYFDTWRQPQRPVRPGARPRALSSEWSSIRLFNTAVPNFIFTGHNLTYYLNSNSMQVWAFGQRPLVTEVNITCEKAYL